MKPEQFIREFGVEKAREVVEGAPNDSTLFRLCGIEEIPTYLKVKDGKYWRYSWRSGFREACQSTYNKINDAGELVSLSDLKRLVEFLDLVETCGGIDSCCKKLSTRDECKPNATHFAIHPEKPHLIQMYRRNEPKLEPNYSFAELKKAVAVHESIYGGGDE
ncbi:hypothetical protein AW812_RS06295 [Acinetobacter baumannii]|nr:hypothetical protein [Acinetobacter baumannii]